MQNEETNRERLTTIPQAAQACGIGAHQLRRAVREGKLLAYQVGGWPRVKPSDVDAWLQSLRTDVRQSA
jgi:excisionase family DNA binding protein